MTAHEAIKRLATVPRLNVVCDFDGTIAPLVDRPDQARALPGSLEALSGLATIEGTHVALLSGRSLEMLARLSNSPPGVTLIGSHGAEVAGTGPGERDGRLTDVVKAFQSLGARFAGSRVESKPAGAAFHYRTVAPGDQSLAAAEAEAVAAEFPGLEMIHGKQVVELVAPGGGKGQAIETFRSENPGPVLFIGDDVTDEQGFSVLRSEDVGVKVGDGETAALHRAGSAEEVVELLVLLLTERRKSASEGFEAEM